MTFPDRDRLREALDRWDNEEVVTVDELHGFAKAARLVASDNVLIVEKVNGEWPHGAIGAIHNWWVNDKGNHPATELLDALLAHQTGDTK